MNIVRLVLYLSLGFMVRSLYLFFFGTGGLVDYHALQSDEQQLASNILELQGLNVELMEQQRALGTDPERVALQARELGYYREGELVLRLEGPAPPRRCFTVGKLLRVTPGAERRDWIAKMLGLIVPLGLFVFKLARERRRRNAPARR